MAVEWLTPQGNVAFYGVKSHYNQNPCIDRKLEAPVMLR